MGAAAAAPYCEPGASVFRATSRDEMDGACEFRRMTDDGVVFMSFNLRAMDQPDTGPNSWAARKRSVVRVLQKYAPDVVATQEGFSAQLADIVTALPHYQAVGKSRLHPEDQEHCDVLVDTGIFEIVAEETIWLSETPEVPKSKSWDSSLPRIATLATLKHRFLDKNFAVISTHFDHQGSVAREKAGEVICTRLGQPVAGSDGAGLLAGDFNLGKRSSVWNNLSAAGFKDALMSVGCADLQCHSFHGFRGGPFTSCDAGADSSSHIDWVLSRSTSQVHFEPVQAAMVPLTWVSGECVMYPSDHLPVVVEFSIFGGQQYANDIGSFRAERLVSWTCSEPCWRAAALGEPPADEEGMVMVRGGADTRGEFFIGRALYYGDWVPGKVSPVDKCCYIASGCKEHRFEEYEVLLLPAGSYRWVGDAKGAFPAGAVPVGLAFYVARAKHSDSLIPGKLHPEHGCCYVPHGHKEHKYTEYEVLACDYHACVSAS